jgi:hypothetical protein
MKIWTNAFVYSIAVIVGSCGNNTRAVNGTSAPMLPKEIPGDASTDGPSVKATKPSRTELLRSISLPSPIWRGRSTVGATVKAKPWKNKTMPVNRGTSGQAIGSAAPTTLLTAASDGAWVAYCQARVDTDRNGSIEVDVGDHGDLYGDTMTPWLSMGSGLGTEIDDVVAASSNDRFVAVIDKGVLAVVDSVQAEMQWFADADARPDHMRARHRAAAFASDGSRLVYFSHDTAVIVDLVAHTRRDVTLPKGLPWRIQPNPVGPWVKILYISKDTDGDGVLNWPSDRTTAPIGKACTGEALSVSASGRSGDQPQSIWLRTDTGEVRNDPQLLLPIDDRLIERRNGELLVDGYAFDPGCVGTLLSVHIADGVLTPRAVAGAPLPMLLSCTNAGGTPSTLTTARMVLGATAMDLPDPIEVDATESPFFTLRPMLCLDHTCRWWFDGTRLPYGKYAGSSASRAIVIDPDGVKVVDRSGVIGSPIRGARTVYDVVGEFALVDGGVVDLRTAIMRKLSGQPLTVSNQGQALVTATPTSDRGIFTGPLQWVTP